MNRRGEAAALTALALLLLALNLTPITNNDLFLHLKTGEVVLETHAVPLPDDYSALARGRPYVAHEWLAAGLFRLVLGALGFNGLVLMKVFVAFGVAGLLYAAARRLGASPAAAVSCLAFVMILAASRFMERPHIFTYLLTAAFIMLALPDRPKAFPELELLNHVPIYLVIITISRDLFISLVAMVMYMALGRTKFPPSLLGKLTTTAQILTVAVTLLCNYLGLVSAVWVPTLIWLSLSLTVLSGFHYIYLATPLANKEPRS